MNESEFLDLLRYYFRKADKNILNDILSDYEEHFAEGRKAGIPEEKIASELGHPKDIYESYQSEGIIKEGSKTSRLTGNAEALAEKASQKAKETWQDISPKIPDAAETTASLLVKIFYLLCGTIGLLIAGVTVLVVYLLSIQYQPFSQAAPLPGLHPVTLVALALCGVFAGLSIFFMGREGRRMYQNSRMKTDNPAEIIGNEGSDEK